MKTFSYTLTALLFFFIGTTIQSQNIYADDSDRVITKVLGTDTIYSNFSLAENLSKIPAFSKQVKVLELIDFDTFIENQQMVTIFVVKNKAFDIMDEKELEKFLSSANAKKLTEMQSAYFIPGRVDEHAIRKAVTDGGGAASFRTINNKTLRFLAEGDAVYLYTENGSKSKLLETNFLHQKGFFHITESLPLKK